MKQKKMNTKIVSSGKFHGQKNTDVTNLSERDIRKPNFVYIF